MERYHIETCKEKRDRYQQCFDDWKIFQAAAMRAYKRGAMAEFYEHLSLAQEERDEMNAMYAMQDSRCPLPSFECLRRLDDVESDTSQEGE